MDITAVSLLGSIVINGFIFESNQTTISCRSFSKVRSGCVSMTTPSVNTLGLAQLINSDTGVHVTPQEIDSLLKGMDQGQGEYSEH